MIEFHDAIVVTNMAARKNIKSTKVTRLFNTFITSFIPLNFNIFCLSLNVTYKVDDKFSNNFKKVRYQIRCFVNIF